MPGLILIVEDEQDLVRTLEYNLRREGYQTLAATTGKAAIELARGVSRPDLVLLDLMLPDMPGSDVCRELKSTEQTRAVPVVIITAKGDEIDRVVGFEIGADDYVVKPFSIRELLLRVRAILRRARGSMPPPPAVATSFGLLRVDPAAHRCWVAGREVILTALEFRLLTTLLDRRGRVQTREVLLTDVWAISAEVTTRTVDTHVKRLRRKLGAAGRYVETLRGVGYRFVAVPTELAP